MNKGQISPEDWIVVPKWEKFQHYSDRRVLWIKVYTELLENPKWLALSMASRGLLVTIWCAYAAENGRIRVKDVAHFCHRSSSFYQLEALSHAGFIDIAASSLLALEVEVEVDSPYPSERGEDENENETTPRELGENPRAVGTNPRAVAKRNTPERRARSWIANGLAQQIPAEHLREVMLDEFKIEAPELLNELVALAQNGNHA